MTDHETATEASMAAPQPCLFSALQRFRARRVVPGRAAGIEGGIGWVPNALERADRMWDRSPSDRTFRLWDHSATAGDTDT